MVGVERTLVDIGNHQHRPAGIEQDLLRNLVVVAGLREFRLQHNRHVVEPGKRPNRLPGFGRDRREGPGAVSDLGQLGLDLEYGDRGVRPLLRALLFGPYHGGNCGAAALDKHPGGAHRFIADGDRIEMRPARDGQRDSDINHRPDRTLGGNMNQNVPEHRHSPTHSRGLPAPVRVAAGAKVTDGRLADVDAHQTQAIPRGRACEPWRQQAPACLRSRCAATATPSSFSRRRR